MNRIRNSRSARRRGFTMAEIMVVVVLIGIVAAMAFPRMSRWVTAISQRSISNQVVADLAYARQEAVRRGQTVSFRVIDATHYSVTVDDAAGNAARVLKRVNIQQVNKASTFTGGAARIAFDSRGLLRQDVSATTVTVTRGTVPVTVRVTPVGRPYRD